MPDTNNTIKVDIVVNTKNSQESITTLKQDINNLKAAIEKSEKTGVNIKFNDTEKNIQQAIKELDKLQNRLDKLESGYGKNVDKSYSKYLRELESDVGRLDEAERKRELSQSKAYEARLRQNQASENYWVNSQLRQATALENIQKKQELADQKRFERLKNSQWYDGSVKGDQIEFKGNQRDSLSSYYNRGQGTAKDSAAVFEAEMKKAEMATMPFRQQLSLLKDEQQSLWKQMQGPGIETSKLDGLRKSYADVTNEIKKTTLQQSEFNRAIGNSESYLGSFSQKFRSHFNWILTGAIMGGVAGGFYEIFHTIANMETEFANLSTVINGMENSQARHNAVVQESFRLAEKYGVAVRDVTEGLRLWARGYKDLTEAEKLNEIALKVSVADNFSPELANRAIEGAVSAFHKQGEAVTFATHVMDSMTKVSHNAQISANDLSEALMRSSAAANTVGVSYDELTAMTATIARNTGLGGATIGDGLKSILNSIHSDKAIKELQRFGVEVYKTADDGTKEFRKISDVLLDISMKAPVAGMNIEKAFRDLAGGRRKLAA